MSETPPPNRPRKPIRHPERRHQAGLLDIRNIIGGLLGAYGVILLIMGLVADTEPEKTGGVNANLWTGIGLLVVAAAFIGWARLRPLLVPDHSAQEKAAAGDRPEGVPEEGR